MVKRLIELCLRNRFLIITAYLFIVGWGIASVRKTPVDAIPDIGEMQVIVFCDWPGRSPKDVEDQVIYPLTVNLTGLPNVKVVRSSSAFSFGMVNIIFEEGTDFYWARTRVLERLNLAQQFLPKDVIPVLGPDATALGQIFWYTVENGFYCPEHPQKSYSDPGKCPIDGRELVRSQHDLSELRSIQDWYVRYQLNAVRGVSEVASVGGYVKQYQIDVDPNQLLAHNVKLSEVFNAVRRSNIDVGAKVFEEGGIEFIVRGIGFIKQVTDIENIVVGAHNGVPVYVKNIAVVTIGPDFRRGALDKEGAEVTGGVVLMRYGENALTVIEQIKEKINELEAGLPPGVQIVPFYDRTGLIQRSIKTLSDALTMEIVVTIAVIVTFLLHFWGSMIISIVLPVGVLISFIIMRFIGVDSNIMSLGGIAIAIGVMVDSGIVMTENIYRRLAARQHERAAKRLSAGERLTICIEAAQEVGPPVLVALLTTIVSFIPIFSLTGQSGKLFRPLAYTKTFAMFGAAAIALTLIPTLCYYLLRGRLRQVEENAVSRFFKRTYGPAIQWSVQHKWVIVLCSLVVFLIGVIMFPQIKREFMPPLNEGDLLFMPVLLPGGSLTQVMDVMKKQDIIIKNEFPGEVEWVVGKLGRAETPTDPAPVIMLETIIHLKSETAWPARAARKITDSRFFQLPLIGHPLYTLTRRINPQRRIKREELIEEIKQATLIPGVSPIMTQPIRNRIDMLATGIQTPVGVKVFGPDLKKIEALAIQIEQILNEVPGTISPYAERIGNRPYYEIEIDRKEIARYGVNLGDVQDIIMTAIGGMNLTTTVEGRERYPVRVRYLRELRDNVEALQRILVPTPSGAQIPLGQLARLVKVPGPAMIGSENTMPYARVFINVDPAVIGLVDYVNLAQKTVQEKIRTGELKLPAGYYIAWSGQYESEVEARERIQVVLPVALFVIFILLFMMFNELPSLLVVSTGLPFSLIGGIILMYILNFKMSVAVWVGFIALFGVATDNAVVLVACLNDLFKQRSPQTVREIRATVVEGGLLRIRPCMMTTTTTILALLPVMLSTGTGSEVMRPMATPTVGGLITATASNMILVPVLYCWLKEMAHKRQKHEQKEK